MHLARINQEPFGFNRGTSSSLRRIEELSHFKTNRLSRVSSGSDAGSPQECMEMSELFGNESVNFKVCIRVRPFIERELKNVHSQESCIYVKKGCLEFFKGMDKKSFNFDYVGGETIDQATIFNHIAKPIA